ncbi:hypothetical protein JTE90_026218 [Oedothorax gibbosus]|uniref:Uncharacterized protein n=1 Tax=Oedothorax gibbosus TaxID=931172 RepID=A0AAV6U0J8_9ARAC|nr:hypothetical protein JTE90_026218 [Oedothorax gibbosus]
MKTLNARYATKRSLTSTDCGNICCCTEKADLNANSAIKHSQATPLSSSMLCSTLPKNPIVAKNAAKRTKPSSSFESI